eukprot:TRINITY_DN14437_c0_g2_i2.p1 TRINITY_DN14437_c0_g2~~TRINITY_DN14437_c0_g2_i2.p1  ORF type:complete len:794 (-),score=317.81 TRINITY_DN14437_c0_g2_i2:41-2422(-)
MFAKGFELPVPRSFTEIVWNDKVFGFIFKKTYATLNHQTGAVAEFAQMNNTLYPYLAVFRENWLALSGDQISMYDKLGKPLPNSSINVHAAAKGNSIQDIKIQNYYLIVLREGVIQIFNLVDFSEVQEIDLERGEVGRFVSCEANRVLVCAESSQKKESLTRVMCLRTVPPKEQIAWLLGQTKIDEARKVFSHNNSPTDTNYETKKEAFNVEAGWQLFKELRFDEAFEFFGSVNYDPREFLALVPDLLGKDKKYLTLTDLNKTGNESIYKEGVRTIINLTEYKRKYLESSFDIEKEGKTQVEFIYPSTPVNEEFKGTSCTLDELMELIDNCLIKLYVQEKDVRQLQNFFETAKVLKCNYREMREHLKNCAKADESSTSDICLAFLLSRGASYVEALEVWQTLGNKGIKELRDLACGETSNILLNHISDKELLFKYARMVLIVNPDEGLKIFTHNPNLHRSITEDDIIEYLGRINGSKMQLKENYLEHLVSSKEEDGRFTNLLALHYIEVIADAVKAEDKKTIEVVFNPIVQKYRDRLSKLLRSSKPYNASRILEAVKGMGMSDEEILLYSKQKKHAEALTILIELGRPSIDFARAEQYCLEQPDSLLADLFEKLMRLRGEAKVAVEKSRSEEAKGEAGEKEAESARQYAAELEQYCKEFLKKHACDEKMNAGKVFGIIPDDWRLVEEGDGQEDFSLLQYLELTFNNRLEKTNNLKVGKRAAEMYKLNLEADLVRLQKAHLIVTTDRMCKVCNRSLGGARSFHVFPNGVLTHSNCTKDLSICPLTNINFSNKIY